VIDMDHSTAATTRQLTLVPIDAAGAPAGPPVRFPADWPSAVEVIDLSAATVDQAVERWRQWITASDPTRVVDALTVRVGDSRIVFVEGREFRATLTDPTGAKVWNATPAGQRDPLPGERCCCGRPAITVYETDQFGDVGYCGIPDGGLR
jgi:hypothetical protein